MINHPTDMDSCRAIVQEAIDIFSQSEEYLVKNNLSERCICARFARYLEDVLRDKKFENYVVDVEYNRNAGNKKTDLKSITPKELGANRRIVVDLIAHKRGDGPDNNLICIEMKKSNNKVGLEEDKIRLRILTDRNGQFHYVAGFMIIINNDSKQHKPLLEIESSYPDR